MFRLSSDKAAGKRARSILAVTVIGTQLTLNGCGIPERRYAQCGPVMPPAYEQPKGWVREKLGWRPAPPAPAPATAAEDLITGSAETDAAIRDLPATFGTRAHQELRFASYEAPHQPTPIEAAPTDIPQELDQYLDAQDSEYNPGVESEVAPAPFPESTVPCPTASSHRSAYTEGGMLLPWNQFFDDPCLVALINQALVGNQELKILAEEIWIANNEVHARSGEYLPSVDIGAGAGLDKSSRFTRNGAVEEGLEVAPGKAFPEPLPDFMVAANLSWEIDIWRKLRNARDAAAFRYLGTQDGQNYVVTRLVAEVAEKYYELLALDSRLEIIDKTIEIQRDSLRVAEAKKEAGRGTELAVQRFIAEVAKNESEKLIIQQEIIEVENRINFLLGRYPQPIERLSLDYVQLNLQPLDVGVPAQLLRNRSDVRQAEREVAAAGLDIEVARAQFYPALNLKAGVGFQAFNPKYLFVSPEALIYNAVGELVAPVVNRRAIQAAYRSANAKQIQSVYDYQRTILNAYTEVVNYMTKVDNYGQSIEIKQRQLEALENSVDSATKLFNNARAEYVEVLLAQREAMEARMILIDAKREQLSAIVNLYQALGGGGGTFLQCR
ncbi:MAG: TolC family protein [Planctomycetaceae bacterium]